MKTVRNKKLTILAVTSMTIFSLAAVFAACIAWFSSNIDVGTNGANLNIHPMNGRLKNVKFYQFVSSANATFSFNKNPFATYTYNWGSNTMVLDEDNVADVWNMGHYTYLSKDHPFLMIFEFDQEYASEEVGDIYIKATTTVGGNNLVTNYDQDDTNHLHPYTTGGGYLGARDQYGSPYYTLPQTQVRNAEHPESILISRTGHDYYALSSVTSFRNKAYDNAGYSSITAGDYIAISTSSLETDETFTTIDNSRNRYYFNQTPYLFKSNGKVLDPDKGVYVASLISYVALVVEFYEDAINYIYSTYLGDAGLENSYQSLLYFACDWSMEVQ